MVSIIKCEKCGSTMRLKTNGLSLEWKCTGCDNAIVTTNAALLKKINMLYTLYMINGDYKNIEHIRFLSQTKNINYIQARSLLKKQKKIKLFQTKMMLLGKSFQKWIS